MTKIMRLPSRRGQDLLESYAAGKRQFKWLGLYQENLCNAVLAGIRVDHTNLGGALLRNADLQDVVLHGAEMAYADLAGANLSRADLSGADLHSACLAKSTLFEIDLRRADLRNADLRGASLNGANLRNAVLSGTNLTGANLSDATLSDANLTGANLSAVDLTGASLSRTILNHATCDKAKLWMTGIQEVDITALCDAAIPTIHAGPSYIDLRTVVLSIGAVNLKTFLQRAGTPEAFIETMIDGATALGADVFRMMRSTFISYGGPDMTFAQQLNDALLKNGVTTFFFANDAIPGEKLHRTMRKGIQDHDRVILICSRASLDREPVLFEIEEALTREAKMKGESLLIPIRLDRYVFDEWKTEREDIAEAVRSRVVADFEGADQDDKKFQSGLRKLLGALRKQRGVFDAPVASA